MKELNETNFRDALKNEGLVLVDFYASWCGPCSMQSEVLNKMQNSRSLNFEIVKVNVDEAPNLAMEYGIQSIPTLMLFKNSKLVRTIVGYNEEDEILKIVEEVEE